MLYFSKKVLYFPKKVLYFAVFLRKIGVRPLHLSVSPSVHRGRVPGQVHPRAGTALPRAGTPPWVSTPPRAVHAGRYGQQAGGTHPTGMHSCNVEISYINFYLDTNISKSSGDVRDLLSRYNHDPNGRSVQRRIRGHV